MAVAHGTVMYLLMLDTVKKHLCRIHRFFNWNHYV